MDQLSGSIILANVYGGSQYGSSAYSATGTNTNSSSFSNSNSGTSSPTSNSTSPSTNTPIANNQTNPTIATQSAGTQTVPASTGSPRPSIFSAGLLISIILTVIALICFFAVIVHFCRRRRSHQDNQSNYGGPVVG